MKLIHEKNGAVAKIGDVVFTARGEKGYIREMPKPHKPSSSGYVYVGHTIKEKLFDGQQSYVGVWGLKWIEREDQAALDNPVEHGLGGAR